jgi:hypothetical protein
MLVIVRSDAVQFGRSILKRRYLHDFPRGLLHYQRSNPHRGTRTFRGRQIGITQATTVYREGGLSYAATAHPPFCDAGSADYRARSAELERRAGQHHSYAVIGNREYDTVILERSADLIAHALVHQALERAQRHQGPCQRASPALALGVSFTYYSS